MNTFKSIDELLRVLEREKLLLKQMFQKRASTSLKYDYALELTEYKEERIKYLIDYGIIRDSGNFLEMEDVYLIFFEDVLQVYENINVSFVDDYLGRLNENIDFFLKEVYFLSIRSIKLYIFLVFCITFIDILRKHYEINIKLKIFKKLLHFYHNKIYNIKET